MTMRRLVVAVLLFLAGCQPLPHPFADAGDIEATTALRPPDSAGILVLPVAGAPALGPALAGALREADVPASTEGANRGSYRLESAVAEETLAPGRESVSLAWELKSAAGKSLGRGTARRETAPEAWQAGASPLGDAIAKEAAPKIARLVSGDAPLPAADVPALVAVRSVSGAPGDGATALARAIATALGRAGVEVGADDAKARFALSCFIAVAPAKDRQQLVSVRWVLALPEGRELGQVSQQNAVPAGSLDGQWGDIAYEVAGAAAPGIAQLIERAQGRRAREVEAAKGLQPRGSFVTVLARWPTRPSQATFRMKILACNSNRPLAEAISAYLNLRLTDASVRRFSDMEIFVEVHGTCAARTCS